MAEFSVPTALAGNLHFDLCMGMGERVWSDSWLLRPRASSAVNPYRTSAHQVSEPRRPIGRGEDCRPPRHRRPRAMRRQRPEGTMHTADRARSTYPSSHGSRSRRGKGQQRCSLTCTVAGSAPIVFSRCLSSMCTRPVRTVDRWCPSGCHPMLQRGPVDATASTRGIDLGRL
jgi:hypothetical protein